MAATRASTRTPWGPWQPFTTDEVLAVLRGVGVPWWFGGGLALEAFVGTPWRDHGDVDVGFFRDDQAALREHLRAWDVRCADPPGTLRPWEVGKSLRARVHDVWVREGPDAPWRFQLMVDEHDGDEWVFRRDARIRRPVATLTWSRSDARHLAPDVQLLYKAKGLRPKDHEDFRRTLPHLDALQRGWLHTALATVHPGHPWLGDLVAGPP
jgi:hypothetical protein